MLYSDIHEGIFIDRPNRFIANVLVDGVPTVCHVKNTGRCRELLVPAAKVLLEKSANPQRKTKFDLVKVYKGERLVNMDSNAPNAVFGEFLKAGGLGFVPDHVKAEYTHGDSRFDYYFEHDGVKAFAEVKGVTLEDNNIALFPDAPTERGIKHLRGLMECVKQGYEAYAVFIIQMRHIDEFRPAWDKHKEFGISLQEAVKAGVKVLAFDCDVTRDGLSIAEPVPVNLKE
ncbi:MAG: DNA/RNA nuclease SfsA [Oscillospiraceae bacterium]|nr:DNA/RNA nuclease SfsA [Oscillospiraceae bacterium]